jgi:hypothetical protein
MSSAFFDVPRSATQFSDCTRCVAPNVPVLIRCKLQVLIKLLLLTAVLYLNWSSGIFSMKYISVSAYGKKEIKQYIWVWRFELVKVGGYGYPHLYDGLWSNRLFCKRRLVHAEFDMLALQQLMTQFSHIFFFSFPILKKHTAPTPFQSTTTFQFAELRIPQVSHSSHELYYYFKHFHFSFY